MLAAACRRTVRPALAAMLMLSCVLITGVAAAPGRTGVPAGTGPLVRAVAHPPRPGLKPAAEPGMVRPPALDPDPVPADPSRSPLEDAFSRRSGTPLTLHGYGLFDAVAATAGAARGAVPASAYAPIGRIGDDYELGPGDVVRLVVRGPDGTSQRVQVDRHGMLVVEGLAPLLAAGRSLGEVRAALAAQASLAWRHARVYVALDAVRRIGVLVVGEVARPGPVQLTALSGVLEALFAAGGPLRTGSLRRVRLIDRLGGVRGLDLYRLLHPGGTGGTDDPAIPPLRDGDRLVVPVIGPTVAIAGAVKRPAIYELAPRDEGPAALDAATLLALAGGPLWPGRVELLRIGPDQGGGDRLTEVTAPDRPLFGDGAILVVRPRDDRPVGAVGLLGHVRHPGPRPHARADRLGALVGPEDLRPGAYRPFAVLETTDRTTGGRRPVAIDLGAVLAGDPVAARPLADGDRLIVLGETEVRFLTAAAVLERLRRGGAGPAAAGADRTGRAPVVPAAQAPRCHSLDALAQAVSDDPTGPLAAGPAAQAARRLDGRDLPCPVLFERHPSLLAFTLAHAVLRHRAVPEPGLVPVAGARAPRPGAVLDVGVPAVRLVGAARTPGTRPLSTHRRLSALLPGTVALADGAYPLFAVVAVGGRPVWHRGDWGEKQ